MPFLVSVPQKVFCSAKANGYELQFAVSVAHLNYHKFFHCRSALASGFKGKLVLALASCYLANKYFYLKASVRNYDIKAVAGGRVVYCTACRKLNLTVAVAPEPTRDYSEWKDFRPK